MNDHTSKLPQWQRRVWPAHLRGPDAVLGSPRRWTAAHGVAHVHGAQDPGRIGLLQSDPREVEELVERFEKARGERKEGVAREICLALTVHSQLEEELVYPIARELLGNEGRDLIDESDVEHATVKRLVVEVESSSLEDALYEAKVRVIGEYVKHHVQEEEQELFAKLGDQLAERKAALMQEWQQAA